MSGGKAAQARQTARFNTHFNTHIEPRPRNPNQATTARATRSPMPDGRSGSGRWRSGSPSAASSSWRAGRSRPPPISPSATISSRAWWRVRPSSNTPMRTVSPNCAPGSIAPPAANCSIRSSSSRSSTICCAARRRSKSHAAALTGVVDPMPTGSIRPAARYSGTCGRRAAVQQLPALAGEPRSALVPRTGLGADESQERQGRRPQRQARRASKPRSTASSGGRPPRWPRCRNATKAKPARLRGVLADLGLKLNGAPRPGSGGPFVPVKLPGEGNGFERALTRVNIARAQTDQLSRSLVFVPVRKPVTGEIDVSSTFGVRVDPFLHIPAMHTGIDFRGDARRSDPRHRRRHRHHGRLERRLRQDGRDRSRQRAVDPLRPSVADRRQCRGQDSDRPDRRPHGLDRAARPARICITRPASTARRSIRRNSSTPAPG